MIILTNNEGKEIRVSYNNKDAITRHDKTTGKTVYTVNMPIVTCDDPLDADYIRMATQKAVNNIITDVLK